MAGVLDSLHELENAIVAALEKLPDPQRRAYEAWINEELSKLGRAMARYLAAVDAQQRREY
jgi:hypothetical protein